MPIRDLNSLTVKGKSEEVGGDSDNELKMNSISESQDVIFEPEGFQASLCCP